LPNARKYIWGGELVTNLLSTRHQSSLFSGVFLIFLAVLFSLPLGPVVTHQFVTYYPNCNLIKNTGQGRILCTLQTYSSRICIARLSLVYYVPYMPLSSNTANREKLTNFLEVSIQRRNSIPFKRWKFRQELKGLLRSRIKYIFTLVNQVYDFGLQIIIGL